LILSFLLLIFISFKALLFPPITLIVFSAGTLVLVVPYILTLSPLSVSDLLCMRLLIILILRFIIYYLRQ